jgi:Spy/CpxP family protein refolding chaperone
MNKLNTMMITKTRLVAVLLLGGLIALSPLTQAAEKVDKPATTKKAGGQKQNADQLLAEKLKLNADQQEKLKPILQEERKKMGEIRKKTELEPKQMREERRKVQEETLAKIKESKILTEEQFAQLKEIRSQRPRAKKQ